jgi:signal peptidase I
MSTSKHKLKPFFAALFNIVYELAVILLLILVGYAFIFGMYRCHDNAMTPSVKDGDLAVYYRLDKDYRVNDVVALKQDSEMTVRRVAAIAGDTVDFKQGKLVLNGVIQNEDYAFGETEQFTVGPEFPLQVPAGMVFVLGDAREHSSDSRVYGCVPIDDTYGTVVMILRRRSI